MQGWIGGGDGGFDMVGEGMSATWETIYRDYTDAELADEREKIKKQLDSAYLSQSTGNKSYTRDLGMLQGRMKAIATVRNERKVVDGGCDPLSGQVDFGGVGLEEF